MLVFMNLGTAKMPFLRSLKSNDTDGNLSPINGVTSFLDGSILYGTDLELTNRIRTFKNGKIIWGEFGTFSNGTSKQIENRTKL